MQLPANFLFHGPEMAEWVPKALVPTESNFAQDSSSSTRKKKPDQQLLITHHLVRNPFKLIISVWETTYPLPKVFLKTIFLIPKVGYGLVR